MHHIISYSILIGLFLFFKILLKNLKSKFYEDHQKFAGQERVPLIGGIIMFCYYSYNISINDYFFLFFSFLILLLGMSSDNNLLQSPRLRLFLQSLILLIFIYFSNLEITDLRSDYLDQFLSNYYFKLFFTTFCLLTLINGSNFIDGLDGLNLGYFFLIIIVIFSLDNSLVIDVNKKQIITIFYIVSFLFLLNIFNYLYLGDSGSYLIGFIFGIFLIDLNSNNYFISPYFIALLLWYPAFENLFSIIRKKVINKDPFNPDNYHFHQLLFLYFKKRKNKFISKFPNILSSISILTYNFIIFLVGMNYVSQTKILLVLISINILLYLTLYAVFKTKVTK